MKHFKLLAIVLCVLLALCGCGKDASVAVIGGADGPTSVFVAEKGEADPAAPPAELIPVTLVLDWTPNVNHLGAYVAQAQGYFADQGLDVTIIQPGDNLALQLVAAGQADFGFSYQEEVTYARTADLPVLSLAAVIQHNTSFFAAAADSGIAAPADFGGKTYGGWGGQVEEALIAYLCERDNVTEPVEIVNLGSADFFSALSSGQIDFSWAYEGMTGSEAELRGVALNKIWLRDLDPVFDYYTPVIAAEESYVAAHPELVRAFMAALSAGYVFADENPEQAAACMLGLEPGLDPELVTLGAQKLAGLYQDDAVVWGFQQQEVWSRFADWLTDRGLLDAGFVAEEAFTNEYLPGWECDETCVLN